MKVWIVTQSFAHVHRIFENTVGASHEHQGALACIVCKNTKDFKGVKNQLHQKNYRFNS